MNNEGVRVRDTRKKEQFVVDDAYLNGWARHCGIYATGVYIALCRHANFGTQISFPSMQTIAEKLSISRKQVQRSIAILEKFNIITKRLTKHEKGGYINEYILLDKSVWKSPTGTDIPSGTGSPNETVNPDHRDCESHCTGTGSPKKDSNRRIQNNSLSERKARNEIQKLFPGEIISRDIAIEKIRYFLAQYKAGKIVIWNIRGANAYLKGLLVPAGWDAEADDALRAKAEADYERRRKAAERENLRRMGLV